MLLQDPAALVERLRAGDIEARERAEAELVRLGAPAEAALDAASKDPDPELAARARALLLEVVAPHRREVERVVAHVSMHARLGIAEAGDSKMSLWAAVNAMKSMDESHPLASIGRSSEGGAERMPDLSKAGLLRSLRYPPGRLWPTIREKVTRDFEKAYERGCADCVERRLSTFRVGLAFENAKVEDILAHLRDVGGVNLILDAGMSDEALYWDRAVTIEAKDVTLADALTRLLAPYGMGFRVTEEGVVLIGMRRKAAE